MKTKLSYLIAILFLTLNGYSQCTDDNVFYIDISPAPNTTITENCVQSGKYITTNVIDGHTYQFSLCDNLDSVDTQLSLYSTTGTVLGYNDDFCDVYSEITWVATFTGSVRLIVDDYNCTSISSNCKILKVIHYGPDISSEILTQIGNEGDSPNTVPSVVTTIQLGQILPEIIGIVAANQTAYQAYIDANPDSLSSPATAAEVQAMVTTVNATLQANIFYVDASKPDNSGDGLSWDTAKKDIQNAIDIASSGKQVWIKAGVYYPNASPNMTASTTVTATSPLTSRDYYIQLKDGVSVFGGFAGTETALSQRNISDNPTYIDGDIGVLGDHTDNCYHLMIYVGTYSTTGITVDGLVLRNGNATRLAASTDYSEETYIFANGFDNPIPRRIGGGLYVGRGLNNTISNIVFENNECEVFGAALYLYGISGTFCTFNVFNCYFVNNRLSASSYGAMCSDGGIVNCYNSVFYNNSCGSNGGDGVATYLMRTKNKLVNCTFANNQSYTGSALSIQSSETTEIYNSIFYGNTRSNPSFEATSGYDFRQFFAGPVPIIKNCSLMHPSANYTAANYTEIDASSSGNIYEQEPNFSNSNNIKGADGKYFTADDGLALLTSSTSKNTGLNSLLPSILTVDITYASRILATNVDMGAYEVDGVMSLSDTILAQIGNEGDAPNTVPSLVTTTQLGAILPTITGIVAANQAAYQAYIDANPSLFSAPATAAEVQAMIDAVNAQVLAQAASDAVLAQIGDEGDAPNTVTSTVTVGQLGVILPAVTGIIAANEEAYQAYIDANPNSFSVPATAAEVQAMIDTVNAQVAAQMASDAVLAQIGDEGDTPNTVTSMVTVVQLGTILPAITGIVAANESAYQAYIDANPEMFSAPATAAEVQAMIDAVNAQVLAQAASDAVLAQIGDEGDAPNTVTSTVTVAQLETILPAITGIVAANESAYQAYIDANPEMFSAPATAAEVQAMIDTVNTALSTTNMNIQTTVIYPNPSNAIFYIEIGTNATVELFDLSGKSLKSDTITVGTTALDLSNYAIGIYFLKISNEINQTKTVRLIKQ